MRREKDAQDFNDLSRAQMYITKRGTGLWLIKPLKDGRVIGYLMQIKYVDSSIKGVKERVEEQELIEQELKDFDDRWATARLRIGQKSMRRRW